jgi:hypothetical protein
LGGPGVVVVRQLSAYCFGKKLGHCTKATGFAVFIETQRFSVAHGRAAVILKGGIVANTQQ